VNQNRVPCVGEREPCVPKNVAQYVHCVARHSDRKAEQLAEDVQRSYDWLIKRTTGAMPCDTPAWLMQALAKFTGRTDHIEALAREANLVCYPLPKGQGRSDRQLADLLREFGEFMTAFADRLSRAHASADDFAIAKKEWRDVVNTGEALMNSVEQIDVRPRPQMVGIR
jgi:hypothetical protein